MSEKLPKVDLIGASVMLLVFHAVLGLLNAVHTGLLLDTDAYMWLNRVLFLHQDGSWFNSLYPRINPPLGHEQHWTRPFDLLLFSGGWMFSLFTDFKTGLHIWAVMLGPLLSVATLLGLLWAVRPLFTQQQSEALGIIFTAQAALLATFLAGRSDHQILLVFLTVLHIGLITRLLLQRIQPSTALAAGAIAALALWVSIESILIVTISFTALAIAWCRDSREYGMKLNYYSLSLLVTLCFALLLEEGIRGFTVTMYDQISVFYLVAAGLNLLLWLSVHKVAQRYPLRPMTHLALLASGAAVAAALLQWLFPGFLQGPLQSVDALYRAVRLEKISELQPVISIDTIQEQGWWQSMSRFIFWLGIALPALPMLFSRIVTSNWPERSFWLFMGLGSSLFLVLAISQIRWANYAILFLLPSYAWLVAWLVTRWGKRLSSRKLPLVRLTVYTLSILWVFLPSLLADSPRNTNKMTDSAADLKMLSEYLNSVPSIADTQKTILANTDFGPELLYRTPHAVLSIPNHRFQPGFTTTYEIFNAVDTGVAHQLLTKSKVNLILIRPGKGERSYYIAPTWADRFYDTLQADQLPPWIRPLELPEPLAKRYRLLEIIDKGE